MGPKLLFIFLLIGFAYTDTNYRLNTPIIPSNYRVTLQTYFDTGDANAFTFNGEVIITFTTNAPTNQIKLHSEELNFDISGISITPTVPFSLTNPLEFDVHYDFVFINFQNELQQNVMYELRIVYTGPIRTDLSGFYRNYYMENGVRKWLGATQMESTHARKVFPCLDEPGLKATFEVIIERSPDFKPSVSNMKLRTTEILSSGMERDTFYTSPIMPTYLVAFVISEFNATRTDDTFAVFARPQAIDQTAYAFDIGRKIVTELGNYLGIDYYSSNENLKLDHFALPDFRAGAMENWGLVTYREALLLYVPGESMPYYKYRAAQIMAHETAHMWFGDLVTCHWWSDTWLNEGFANYFQDYITAKIDPELGSENLLVTGSVYAAYDADDSPTSPPISNENVNSPSEISAHFGTVTYQKAGSVIRMMHHLIGDDAFKFGLNNYLNTVKFGSGYPEILYNSLDIGVTQYNSLSAYPNTSVRDIMSSWITQAGHPVVTVTVDYENQKATLTQRRFFEHASFTGTDNAIYKIPISYTLEEDADFTNTTPAFILETESQEISLNMTEHSWVIFNIQESGLYRVNYDDHTWTLISEALDGGDRQKIHHLNRAKIVNDIFAFYFADMVTFNQLHEVIDFLKDEDDYSVWYAALHGLNRLRNRYVGTNVLPHINAYALDLIENIIDELGYEDQQEDSFETLRNRLQILDFACKLGHEECVEKTVEMFNDMKENRPIPSSLRSLVYCTGLRAGNGADYEYLWNRMLTTNLANEARTILEILGCTSDEEKTKDLLLSVLLEDTPIYTQDITAPLTSIMAYSNHIDVVLDNLNCTEWSVKYPSMETVLTTIAANLRTDADIETFESQLESKCGADNPAVHAAINTINNVKAERGWAELHASEVMDKIGSNAITSAPSYIILGITVASALMVSNFN